MTDLSHLTRRDILQSLLFLPGAAASILQDPLPPEKARPIWNGVYSDQEAHVTGYPNRFLADVVQGRTPGRALDIGMGQGRNSLFLARLGWDVTGVDVSDKGIEIAQKDAEKSHLKISCIAADFTAYDMGKEKWDLIAGIYMGGLMLTEARRIGDGLRPGGLLVIENYHRDINRNALTGGKIGYPVNILLETYVPLLRIVHYEEVLDFPDWSNQGEKVPLVRLLAKKG